MQGISRKMKYTTKSSFKNNRITVTTSNLPSKIVHGVGIRQKDILLPDYGWLIIEACPFWFFGWKIEATVSLNQKILDSLDEKRAESILYSVKDVLYGWIKGEVAKSSTADKINELFDYSASDHEI
jgi:hypothetical protein